MKLKINDLKCLKIIKIRALNVQLLNFFLISMCNFFNCPIKLFQLFCYTTKEVAQTFYLIFNLEFLAKLHRDKFEISLIRITHN